MRESQSFEQLRIVNDHIWSIFRVVYVARRLLKNYNEWINCFIEIIRFFIEKSLRCLFVTVLIHDEIVDSRVLWDRFCSNICDDLSHRIRQFLFVFSNFVDSHLNYDLYLIVKDLQEHNKTLVDFELSSSVLRDLILISRFSLRSNWTTIFLNKSSCEIKKQRNWTQSNVRLLTIF